MDVWIGRLRRMLPVFGFWTVFGLFWSVQAHYEYAQTAKPMPWRTSFFNEFTYAYIACALTPLVLYLADRYPLTNRPWFRNALIHLCGLVAFAFVEKLTWDLIVNPWYYGRNFAVHKALYSVFLASDMNAMLYGIIVLAKYAGEYYRRYQAGVAMTAELQAQLAQAQLLSLKMQLNPHFLFNTLHSISALIQEDAEGAETMIARLSDLLRISLDNPSEQEVPLRQELDFLKLYLEIEQIRFEDRLTVQFEIDSEAMEALVPNMILQPLVENAIKHGIANRSEGGRVVIAARKRATDLLLRVYDNGSDLPADAIFSFKEGVGLATTRGRLDRLYGDRQRLELEVPEAGGLVARIILPLRTR
jgi:two-component system LytT family sensor kinase